MKKVKLGNTNIDISQMGLGHCDFGTKISKDCAFEVLDEYAELGGNFIDTSNNYALWNPGGKGGECETVIGDWIQSRGNREQIVLATKVGAHIPDISTVTQADGSLRPDWYLHGEGLSKTAIINAIEGSLRRLRTDYIDLYYAHVEDAKVEQLETLEAFQILHQQGKIRAIGCSNHHTWRLERARQLSREHQLISYCCTQDLHTFLPPDPNQRVLFANEEKLDYLRQNPEITLVAYTPTLWGKLAQTDRYEDVNFWEEFYTPTTPTRLKALRKTAVHHEASEIQIVYAWMMQNTPRAVPLITTSSVAHLRENIASIKIKLSQEEMQMLNHPKT